MKCLDYPCLATGYTCRVTVIRCIGSPRVEIFARQVRNSSFGRRHSCEPRTTGEAASRRQVADFSCGPARAGSCAAGWSQSAACPPKCRAARRDECCSKCPPVLKAEQQQQRQHCRGDCRRTLSCLENFFSLCCSGSGGERDLEKHSTCLLRLTFDGVDGGVDASFFLWFFSCLFSVKVLWVCFFHLKHLLSCISKTLCPRNNGPPSLRWLRHTPESLPKVTVFPPAHIHLASFFSGTILFRVPPARSLSPLALCSLENSCWLSSGWPLSLSRGLSRSSHAPACSFWHPRGLHALYDAARAAPDRWAGTGRQLA